MRRLRILDDSVRQYAGQNHRVHPEKSAQKEQGTIKRGNRYEFFDKRAI
jgi:hypothetical protein